MFCAVCLIDCFICLRDWLLRSSYRQQRAPLLIERVSWMHGSLHALPCNSFGILVLEAISKIWYRNKCVSGAMRRIVTRKRFTIELEGVLQRFNRGIVYGENAPRIAREYIPTQIACVCKFDNLTAVSIPERLRSRLKGRGGTDGYCLLGQDNQSRVLCSIHRTSRRRLP